MRFSSEFGGAPPRVPTVLGFLHPLITALAFTVVLAVPLRAQNPDLMLTQAQRDSILATYDNIFPIWGRKAVEKGFDLPYPFGINVIGMHINQGIEIGNLGLSTGNDPVTPIEAIQFGDNEARIQTVSLRADLWVLPFLNAYLIGGSARANTEVEVTTPVEFTTSVDQTGSYFGTGITGAFGIRRSFVSVDVNWTWIDLEKLDDPVRNRLLSVRVGRNLKLGPQKRLTLWVGAMNAKFKTETRGSILLSEAIPPETVEDIRDRLEDVDESDWYQDLGPLQKGLVDRLVDRLLTGGGGDTQVNYSIDKAPTNPWNMVLGANLDFNKRWTARTEFGMIGRFSAMASIVYRLGF